jgi:hypothetical protein
LRQILGLYCSFELAEYIKHKIQRRKVSVLRGKFWSRVESSGLGQQVPGYAPGQKSWKISLQAGCGLAACRFWPGILGNHAVYIQSSRWVENPLNY